MKHIFVLALLTLTSLAHARTMTCTMETLKEGKKDSVTVSLDTDSDFKESEGLDVGEYNYSYALNVETVGKKHEVQVILYENNSVQDEVGGLSCFYDPKKTAATFCKDTVTDDDDKKILKFYCKASR